MSISDEIIAHHETSSSSAASVREAENEVPLSAAQARDLGRVIALASQLEMLVVELISSLSGTPAGQVYAEFERRTLGPKIRVMVAALPNGGASAGHGDLAGELDYFLRTRNHLVHGLWAYALNVATKRGTPACVHGSKVIYPWDLGGICDRFSRLSRRLGAELSTANPRFPLRADSPIQFFVTTENVDVDALGLTRASI